MKIITDKNEALELIKKEPRIFLLCSDELRADKEVVLEFFKQNGYTLLGALQDDKEIVEIAVNQNGLALRDASERLQDNGEIVEIAVNQNGLALRDVSQRLRDNEEIVEIAVKQNGEALEYAGDDLKIAIMALQELTNNLK
jgi:hypothetical protein